MDLLSEIVGQRQLVRDVHESLESASRSGLLMGPALISADRWLEHTLARVTLGFDAHPSGKLVWRLIALDTQPDDPESLSDHDLLGALGFISGHLRTKFQGYLAEALAAGPICQLLQALGADDSQLRKAKLVWGDDIHVRPDHLPPTDSRRELGPDALVAVADEGVEPPRLTIMASSKSSPTGRASRGSMPNWTSTHAGFKGLYRSRSAGISTTVSLHGTTNTRC